MENIAIAQAITQQLGLEALKLLGADRVVEKDFGLGFNVSGSKAYNYISITLTDTDLYNLSFMQVTKKGIIKRDLVDNIPAAELHRTIEQRTGLSTKR